MSIFQRNRRIPFKKIGTFLLSLFMLSSCADVFPVASGEEKTSESISSLGEKSETSSLSFSRDEEGFKILEKDYFSNKTDSSKGETSQVKFGEKVEDVPLYSSFKLFLAGEEVPIYSVKINQDRTWSAEAKNRIATGVASFSLKGKVTLKLQCAFNPLNDVKIRPLGRNVPYQIDQARWVISLAIDTPGQYVIETRYRTLHLFVNEWQDAPQDAMVFSAGLHTKENDSRINSNNEIILHNGSCIFLEEGAILRAKFKAYDASHISISGPGFIDGSLFERDVSKGIANIPFDISFCNDVTLQDFAILDPAGWAFNLYFSSDLKLKNTKVISSRSNGDGISVQSCKKLVADSCFVRSWDDSLVVKNYVNWRTKQEGETSSIHFKNCLIITDLAQAMEIGYETIGEKMEDISFENISILHAYHKPVFSIHNGNNAKIRNVTYKNITVEDLSIGKGDGTPYLFDFDVSHSPIWSDAHKITALGDIDGVHAENVKILSGRENPKIKITGSKETRDTYPKEIHKISNVTFQDVDIYGKILDSSYPYMETSYAENIQYQKTGKEIVGASYPKTDVSSFSNNVIRVK